jgi:hypothetical protein
MNHELTIQQINGYIADEQRKKLIFKLLIEAGGIALQTIKNSLLKQCSFYLINGVVEVYFHNGDETLLIYKSLYYDSNTTDDKHDRKRFFS